MLVVWLGSQRGSARLGPVHADYWDAVTVNHAVPVGVPASALSPGCRAGGRSPRSRLAPPEEHDPRHTHSAVAEALLAGGAAVNVEESNRATPLHMAAFSGHSTVAEALLAGGAALNLKANDGNTPLGLATDYGHSAVAALLRRQGAYSAEL